MKISDLYNQIKKTNIPVAYRIFKKEQELPFCIYALDSSDDFTADNKHYKKIESGFIEIYSYQKDTELESRLEGVLSDTNDLAYKRVLEDYLSDEGAFLVRFEFQMIIDKENI